MKKAILFLVLIFSFNTYSQDINFDTFIEYKTTKTGLIHYFFFNATNNNCHFSGYNNDNDKILGSLIEKQKNKSHLYYLKNQGNSIVFDYYYSREFNPNKSNNHFASYYYEMKEESIDSVSIKTTFFGYKNKKKKKLIRTIEVITIKSNLNYKFDFLNSVTHSLFINSNIETLDGLPISIKIFDKKNKLEEEIKLITNKDVKAKITLPKPEIY